MAAVCDREIGELFQLRRFILNGLVNGGRHHLIN